MFKTKCDICGEHVTSQYGDAALARSLGLHKWNKHGIRGKFNAMNQLKKEAVEERDVEREVEPVNPRGLPDSAITPAQRKRRKYQRNWWARNYGRGKQLKSNAPTQSAEVVPCKLDTCPHCGARFYVARGQQV